MTTTILTLFSRIVLFHCSASYCPRTKTCCFRTTTLFHEKETSSQNTIQADPTSLVKYRVDLNSGDTVFLNQVSLMMEMMVAKGFGGSGGGGKSIAGDGIVFGGAGPKAFASFYVPFMVAYKTLSDAGRLDSYEYEN